MAREGQGYSCWRLDMMMMMSNQNILYEIILTNIRISKLSVAILVTISCLFIYVSLYEINLMCLTSKEDWRMYRLEYCANSKSQINCLLSPVADFLTSIIILMSCRKHGYPWPSFATPPYRSSLLVGPQGYIQDLHRPAVCRFELVVLLLLGHMRGSIGGHNFHDGR